MASFSASSENDSVCFGMRYISLKFYGASNTFTRNSLKAWLTLWQLTRVAITVQKKKHGTSFSSFVGGHSARGLQRAAIQVVIECSRNEGLSGNVTHGFIIFLTSLFWLLSGDPTRTWVSASTNWHMVGSLPTRMVRTSTLAWKSNHTQHTFLSNSTRPISAYQTLVWSLFNFYTFVSNTETGEWAVFEKLWHIESRGNEEK